MVYVHASLNFGGGVGSVVKQLAKQQIDHGDTVYILARKSDYFAAEIAENVFAKIVYLKEGNNVIPKSVKGYNLKREFYKIKSQNLDKQIVLICHCIGVVGMLGSIPKQTIIVLHGHVKYNGYLSKLFYKLLYKRHKSRNYIACSKECADYYFEQFKLKCKVVLNGCACIGKKKEFYPSKGDFAVGMISNLDNHKGFEYLLGAAKLLNKKYNFIKFYIVGANSEKFDFDGFFKSNGMENVIEYLGEVKNAADKILPQIDLLVLPSIMEGLPMSLIEAQSYGIPILATEVGGIPEILKDGYNGFFIRRDENDIAEKIGRCLNNSLYGKLVSNSLSVYKTRFSAERMYKEYENLIRNIVGFDSV